MWTSCKMKMEESFMEGYGPMLPCHTAKMKSKIMKQVLITVIFLCALVQYKHAWTEIPEKCSSRKHDIFFVQLLQFWLYCNEVRPITCNWILLLTMPQGTSIHFYVPLKGGDYSSFLKKHFLHSLVVTGTAYRAAVCVPYQFQLLVT